MRAHFPNNPRAPLVLVYDFAALLDLSGVRPKLPTVKHGLPLSRQTSATRQHKRGNGINSKLRKVVKIPFPVLLPPKIELVLWMKWSSV
jgi:hypothetical protein